MNASRSMLASDGNRKYSLRIDYGAQVRKRVTANERIRVIRL